MSRYLAWHWMGYFIRLQGKVLHWRKVLHRIGHLCTHLIVFRGPFCWLYIVCGASGGFVEIYAEMGSGAGVAA